MVGQSGTAALMLKLLQQSHNTMSKEANSRHGSRSGAFRKLEWGAMPEAKRMALQAALPEAAIQEDPFLKAFRDSGMEPPTVPGATTAAEEFIPLLRAAAEIEQALMVQYLYAWLTSGDEANRIDDFRQIAVQEMGHLFTVQNLLRALGESVHLDLPEPSMPDVANTHPFPLHLGPLSRKLLAQYVTAESPLAGTLAEPARTQAIQAAADAMLDVRHVGLLFLKLYWLAQPSRAAFGPWNPALSEEWETVLGTQHLAAPVVNLAAQRSWNAAWDVAMDDSNFLDLSAAKNLFVARLTGGGVSVAEQICRAFYSIGTQGEGYASDPLHAGHGHESHFEKFLALYNALPPSGEPSGAIQTVPNPWVSETGAAADPILEASRLTHPDAVILAKAFNLRYERILLLIALTFAPEVSPDNAALLATIRSQSVGTEMRRNIVNLADALLKLPAKADGSSSDLRAGPPFQAPEVPTTLPEIRMRLAAVKQETETLNALFPAGITPVSTTADQILLDQTMNL
jgi:hypothetical protein